jgi:gliding motility-associated-like protein
MKKDVGQLYKDAFKEYSPEPSPGGFERIRAGIPGNWRRMRMITAAGIVIGIAGLALLLIPSPKADQVVEPTAMPALQDVSIPAAQPLPAEKPQAQFTPSSSPIPSQAPLSVLSQQNSPTPQHPLQHNTAMSVENPVNLPGQVPSQAAQLPANNSQLNSANTTSENQVPQAESSVTFSSDTTICLGGSAQLQVFGAQFCKWIDGQTSSGIVVEPLNTTSYTVEATGFDGKLVTGRIVVKVDDCESIFVPSGFTPNGDGLNDVFRVMGNDVKGFNLRVFSRNGELLFESNDMEIGWAGDIKGSPAAEGAYVFVISYTNKVGIPVSKRGSVTLLR